MKNQIKNLLKRLLGKVITTQYGRIRTYLAKLTSLIQNTYEDGRLFYKHSMVFKQDTFNKIESKIILHYHGLEKGFLFSNFKYRFGQNRVAELISLLKIKEIVNNHQKSQIAAAYLSMCKYYEKHQESGVNISDFFKKDDYVFFKSLSTLNFEITKSHNRESFFEKTSGNFFEFAESRKSIRTFTGDKIPIETIEKVIEIAKTAPSVCNRQPTKVYYLDDKPAIERVLFLQQGLAGHSEKISQLLIVVSDRNYFYSIGERNQLYIDSGIFVMNLLYGLHFYKIAACPAHWGFPIKHDKKIQKELNLSNSEKVICLIPIGIPPEEFRTTLSLRRENREILKVIGGRK